MLPTSWCIALRSAGDLMLQPVRRCIVVRPASSVACVSSFIAIALPFVFSFVCSTPQPILRGSCYLLRQPQLTKRTMRPFESLRQSDARQLHGSSASKIFSSIDCVSIIALPSVIAAALKAAQVLQPCATCGTCPPPPGTPCAHPPCRVGTHSLPCNAGATPRGKARTALRLPCHR